MRLIGLLYPKVDNIVDEALEEADLTDESKRILEEIVGEDNMCVLLSLTGPAGFALRNVNPHPRMPM